MKVFKKVLALAACASIFLSGAAFAADAPKDLVLKGDAKCTSCHDESDSPKVLSIATTRHGVRADGRTPSCTDCHGASETHLKEAGRGSGKTPPPDVTFGKKSVATIAARNGACLSCHEKDDKRTHWTGSQHANNDVTCTSCHQVHTQHDKVRDKKTQAEVCFTCHKTERADSHKFSSHPLSSGKIACSDCHNAHGSAGPKLLKKNTLNETCFTCHAEKRGPFLWEHQPVTEDCSSCHTPHGSNISPLLKSRPPFMCNECHDGPHSKGAAGPNIAGFQGGYTGANPSGTVGGRACMNCHVMVHGSNHPAGAWLHR